MEFFRREISSKVLLVLVLLQLIYLEGAEIKKITENTIRPSGGEVEFSCILENTENYTLLWSKVSDNRLEQFPLAINETLLNPNNKFTVKYNRKTSNYTLKIQDLEPSDAGFYQCQISLDIYQKRIDEVRLDIEQAPKITNISQSSESIAEGKSITLYCQATGQPMPRISWKRKNHEIFPFGSTLYSGDTLYVPSVHRVDRGMYYCIAENGIAPEASEGIRVNVEFAPTVTTPRPRVGQAKGYSAKLQCHVEGYPIPSVIWLKNGREIDSTETPVSSTDEFIHSHYINLIGASDYGLYSCRVQNNHGVSEAVIELFETEIPWISSD